MAGVDDHEPVRGDVEHGQEEGDVHVQHAVLGELEIEPGDDPGGVGLALQEEPDLGREPGRQEGGGQPLADHVAHGDGPPPGGPTGGCPGDRRAG